MDCESLMESLWRDGERKIREIEAEAGEEAEKIETEVSLRVTALKEHHEKNMLADSEKRTSDILTDANQKADLIRIAAFRKLLSRLYQLARSSLMLLRNERYGDLFTALTAEIPSLPWKSVRVHPGDTERAQKSFPGAEIIADDTISGGMDVMTGDGKVRVINTFEKRLERAWEEMSSDLLQEDYEAL